MCALLNRQCMVYRCVLAVHLALLRQGVSRIPSEHTWVVHKRGRQSHCQRHVTAPRKVAAMEHAVFQLARSRCTFVAVRLRCFPVHELHARGAISTCVAVHSHSVKILAAADGCLTGLVCTSATAGNVCTRGLGVTPPWVTPSCAHVTCTCPVRCIALLAWCHHHVLLGLLPMNIKHTHVYST